MEERANPNISFKKSMTITGCWVLILRMKLIERTSFHILCLGETGNSLSKYRKLEEKSESSRSLGQDFDSRSYQHVLSLIQIDLYSKMYSLVLINNTEIFVQKSSEQLYYKMRIRNTTRV